MAEKLHNARATPELSRVGGHLAALSASSGASMNLRSSALLVSGLVLTGFAVPALAAGTGAPANATLESGYAMASFATGLNFPTAIALTDTDVWVSEAGI